MLMRRPLAISCALTLLALGVAAVSMEPSPASPPAEARQFDFWLGEWEVTSPDGRRQGTSRVELVAQGYGVLEHWRDDPAAGNSHGSSLNAWNPQKKRWQQFWVGGSGTVLELGGGLDPNGRMVLEGEQADGERRWLNRISWTPNTDGTVRQVWEQSLDKGQTWRPVFDGRYARMDSIVDGGGCSSRSRAMYYMFL